MAEDFSSRMYFAVTSNDATALQDLITQGGDVDTFYDDTSNISSKSLLHVCCGRGHVQCLRILIDNGATLDIRDGWGQTPLMYCITIQFPEAAQMLLAADPSLIKCQDRFGKSPLHCAVATGSDTLVFLLLRHGADVNVRCHAGLTPLMHCCMADPEGEKVKVLDMLLAAGSLVDLGDYRGRRTALHMAITGKNKTAVEKLIAANSDVNAIEKNLLTPLTLALRVGVKGALVDETHAHIISLLVSAGADLNMTMNERCNPLFTAALLRSESAVRFFLSLGADPDIKTHSGVTPALVCASTGDLTSMRALLHHNCRLSVTGSVYKRRRRLEYKMDAFELAYTEGHFHLCRLFVECGYRVFGLLLIFLKDLARVRVNNFQEGDDRIMQIAEDIASEFGLTLDTGQCTSARNEITVQHAQTLPEDVHEFFDLFIKRATNPRMLKEESVFAIRSVLGARLLDCVHELPLPTPMKQFVMLAHLGLCEPIENSGLFKRL